MSERDSPIRVEPTIPWAFCVMFVTISIVISLYAIQSRLERIEKAVDAVQRATERPADPPRGEAK